MASPFKFAKHGQSGLEVSELFPHIATCVDDLCVVRSMVHDDSGHSGGCLMINTGERLFVSPQHGRLGDVRLGHREPEPAGLHRHRPAAADSRGRRVRRPPSCPPPTRERSSPTWRTRSATFATVPSRSSEQRQRSRRCWASSTDLHRDSRSEDSRLNARIESFELAFRMQTAGAGRIRPQPRIGGDARRLYGIGTEPTGRFRPAVPAGPSAGRTRRPVHPGVSHTDGCQPGTSTATLKARTRQERAGGRTSRSPAC